jgi:hypothetical protein
MAAFVSPRVWLLMAVAAASTACGASTRSLTADPQDYGLYRRTRTAETAEARLTASAAYLDSMPEGRWKRDVESWFSKAEPAYYAWASRTPAGLRRYLNALPHGPHARAAAERIAELALAARLDEQRDERVLEEALSVEEKLADADTMRRAVVSAVTSWTRRFSEIRTWGDRTSALDSELIFHFRLEEPEGRCVGNRCVKSLGLHYAIPDGGRLAARKALIDVEIDLEDGGVAKARLAGPELWSRLSEASEVRAVKANDAQARAEAIARSVQIVEGALPPALARVECRREAVAPVVSLHECEGVRVTMRAATTPELDDELVIEPVLAPRAKPP